MRSALFFGIFCLTSGAWASTPKFSEGGLILGLDVGVGVWAVDATHLGKQSNPAAAQTFVSDLATSPALAVSAAYVIRGHASVGAELTATGWDLPSQSRGGAGFLVGLVGWHPLELVWRNHEERPVPLDARVVLGFGYGIVGERLGADGLVVRTGLQADWWFTPWFGVGAVMRLLFLRFGQLYYDFNNRSLPGNTVPLPESSGGAFVDVGLTLLFRLGR